MQTSDSPKKPNASLPPSSTKTIADIVLDPNAYSTLLSTQQSNPSSPPNQPELVNAQPPLRADGHTTSSHRNPSLSIADLVLDNVTYDKILSSSAKGLALTSASEHSPPPILDDSRTPPNSPTTGPEHQSLMGISATIMTSGPVETSGQIDKMDTTSL